MCRSGSFWACRWKPHHPIIRRCAASGVALSRQALPRRCSPNSSASSTSAGLILKRGTMIDASLVETPFRPSSFGGGRKAVDGDAAFTAKKQGRGHHYGYKVHIGVDQDSRLIRRLDLTPADIADTTAADALVCGDEQAVYADKGYAKRERRAWLKRRGIKPRIMHKSWGGGPKLTAWQRHHNRLIAPIRAQVEGVFATFKRWMGLTHVRYKGLARNKSHWFLAALAYNMNRALKLT